MKDEKELCHHGLWLDGNCETCSLEVDLTRLRSALQTAQEERYQFQTYWLNGDELLQAAQHQWDERITAEVVIADVINRLDKHTRALHFQRTTAANVADLVDAICETDSRHVQEKQAAEAKLQTAEQERDAAQNQCADHQRGENEALNQLSTLLSARDRLVEQMKTLAIRRRGRFDPSDRDAATIQGWADELASLGSQG